MALPFSGTRRVGKHQMPFFVNSNFSNVLYKIIDDPNDVWRRLPRQRFTVYDLHERSQLNIYQYPMITTILRAANESFAILLPHIQSKHQLF